MGSIHGIQGFDFDKFTQTIVGLNCIDKTLYIFSRILLRISRESTLRRCHALFYYWHNQHQPTHQHVARAISFVLCKKGAACERNGQPLHRLLLCLSISHCNNNVYVCFMYRGVVCLPVKYISNNQHRQSSCVTPLSPSLFADIYR